MKVQAVLVIAFHDLPLSNSPNLQERAQGRPKPSRILLGVADLGKCNLEICPEVA